MLQFCQVLDFKVTSKKFPVDHQLYLKTLLFFHEVRTSPALKIQWRRNILTLLAFLKFKDIPLHFALIGLQHSQEKYKIFFYPDSVNIKTATVFFFVIASWLACICFFATQAVLSINPPIRKLLVSINQSFSCDLIDG